ncbi:hypothetical protein SASPL_116937 [Salvia splendens]|uniref:Uncharacterized protein n=1 Tax=Salvia splendens TaxID=180675 RepID=A0A8X8XYB7_SALSN|nr:hypothetical protein SASPL_116937 [Salvia splendens]
MSKMLGAVVVTLLAFSALVELSSAKFIGYPVIGVDNPSSTLHTTREAWKPLPERL